MSKQALKRIAAILTRELQPWDFDGSEPMCAELLAAAGVEAGSSLQALTRERAQQLGIPNLWLLVERLTIRTGCETELNRQADLAKRELEALLSAPGAKEPMNNIPEFIEPRYWIEKGMHGWGVFYQQEGRTLAVGCVQGVEEAVARNVAKALNDVLYEEVTAYHEGLSASGASGKDKS
jgi:hypothetical protein